jgi:uncharacterized DUF497 family protein
MMRFEWDENKNQDNRRRHGIDFGDVPKVFGSPMLVAIDDRQDYGEERWLGIGVLKNRTIVVVYTERGAHERQHFERFIADRLGPG